MPTERKAQIMAELKEVIERSTFAVSTDYRGLKVKEIQALRRKIKETGADYRVVKNTITAFAAEQAGRPDFAKILQGPSAVLFAYGDAVEPAKALTEYIRQTRLNLPITAAYLDGQILNAVQVQDLASLPPKEQLIAELMAKFNSPIATFAGLMQGALREFAALIDARAGQLEAAA